MFRRHKTATRFYSYLSAQKVSGTDLLTGHHSWFISSSLLSFQIFLALSVLPHTNFAHSRHYLPSTLFSLHSHHPPAAHVFISPPLNMSFEETYSSICPTLPQSHIQINLPLHFGLFLPKRLSRHLVPPVKLTNKAATPGELTFSTLILLSLISISLFIAPLTMDFPLLLYTTPRP